MRGWVVPVARRYRGCGRQYALIGLWTTALRQALSGLRSLTRQGTCCRVCDSARWYLDHSEKCTHPQPQWPQLPGLSVQRPTRRWRPPDLIRGSDSLCRVVQVAEFFEANVGPVAKINVQRDCRRLIALGRTRHDARLAAERHLQNLLRACTQITHATKPILPAACPPAPLAPESPPGEGQAVEKAAGAAPSGVGGSAGAFMRGRAWSEGRMRQELKGLKALEARVEALTRDMQEETLRQRPIVSAFVTFKCDTCRSVVPLRCAELENARMCHCLMFNLAWTNGASELRELRSTVPQPVPSCFCRLQPSTAQA